MAKPKAITRAITLLTDAQTVEVDRHGGFTASSEDRLVLDPGGVYRLIADADAVSSIAALTRADARTRLDKKYRKPRKKAARKVATR